jgi:nickel superoxide dismutase
MKALIEKNKMFVLSAAGILVLLICCGVYSHCQLPCGIYDDNMRFNMMAENIVTIEKSMKMINELSGEPKPNMNQIVRWVENKEDHSGQLSHTITYYFMAQRLNPVEDKKSADYENYTANLVLLHRMLVLAMKAKQSTDLAVVNQLNKLLEGYKKLYFQQQGSEHKH